MQNVYKLTHLVRVEIPGKYKKLKTNEARKPLCVCSATG